MQSKFWQSKFCLFALGLLTAGALTSLAPRAMADGVDPLDANRRRTEDPFSNQNSPTSSDPFFDIMHRAQLGNIRSLPEFGQDQQENIGSQASDFRTRQRELILQNQQQQTEGAVPTQPASSDSQL